MAKNGKKIKKVTLKTPYQSSTFTPTRRAGCLFVHTKVNSTDFSNDQNISCATSYIDNGATTTDRTYVYTDPTTSSTETRASIEYKLPENLPGENSEIVLSLGYTAYPCNYTGTAPYNFDKITNKNIETLREPFGISAIDIEYYGDDELPKYINTVTCGKDNGDKIEIERDGKFVDINKIEETSLNDATIKLRIGGAFVEITKSTSKNTTKPTVTFDKERSRIGVHGYATIKSYLDPETYKFNGIATTPYKMTYIVNGQIPSGTSSTAYHSAKSMSSNATKFSSSGITYTNHATLGTYTGNEIISLSKFDGLNEITLAVEPTTPTTKGNWGTPTCTEKTITNFQNKVQQGDEPAFSFDGITFLIPSDSPNPPSAPIASADIAEATAGVYKTTTPFNLTLSQKNDDYESNLIKYVITDTRQDVETIDWPTATEYTQPINLTSSKYIYAIVISTLGGETYNSRPIEIAATILEPVKISDLADLHKAENDGELVLLQMPLMVRGNCKMNEQGASAPNKFTNVVYARDANGIAVKLISRRNATSDDDFPSSLSYSTPTIDRIYLVPINTVVGKYHYNNGINPEIIIRDLTSDPADDYYAYQGKESAVQVNRSGGTSVITEYEGISFANGKATKLATDEEYTDITDLHSLLGKIVILRGLANWNATENTFELSESADKKTIKIRSGATVEGSLSAGSGHTSTAWNPTLTGLSSDKRYSVIAAIEYDPKANDGEGEYYLAPYSFLENFAIPTLQIPEADKDKFVTKTDDKGNITEIEYTEEVTSGKIYLTLDLVRPAGVNFSSLILKDEEGKTIQDQYYNAQTSYKFEIPTSKQTFDEESGTAVIYASAYSKGNYNVNNSGEKLKITIRDAVQTGPEVLSIEEFRTKMQNGGLSADKPVYVRFNGRFAVVARNGNVLQLRDVDKDLPLNPANASDTVTVFKDSYILVHDNNEWEYTYTKDTYGKVTSTGFPVTYSSYSGNNLWETYAKGLAIGEEIREFIGKVTIDKAGNFDVDLTDLGNFFRASALFEHRSDNPYVGEVSVPGYQQGTPRFFPYMSATDEQGNLVMREENCVNRPVEVALSDFEEHPESHPDNIELSDALLDAEMKVMKVQVEQAADDYTALFTADGVALLWDMFGTDQTPSEPSTAALADEPDGTTGDDTPAEPAKSVKQQLADHMAAGTEHFNVTGILRKHTDGKYALQVEKIEPTPVDKSARFFADGEEIEGDAYEFVKRVDLTTDTPEGAVIKMTVGDGQQQAYDAEALKSIDADTKVTIERWVPGLLKGQPASITLTKLSTDINTLAQMAEGTNARNLYHFRKHLKVIAADGEGHAMAADAAGRIALIAGAPAEAAAGKYIADVALVRSGDYAAAIHADETVSPLDEENEYAIATPEAVTVSAIDPAAHTGKAVTLFGAAIKEGTAVENEGQGASYAIDPTFEAIPTADAEGWKLTGYVLPGADSKPVIYLTAAQALDRVALPVITPAEAAFLDQTTVTIDCATTGAAIEYSTDGGKTWNAYTTPFKVEATGTILARATAEGMLPSR